jgi:hypothetical protein
VIRRLTYLSTYAALASLGEGLVARPALLWIRSQGFFSPALAWDIPYGPLFLGCAALLALLSFALASAIGLGRKPRQSLHPALLLAAGICFALRSASGNPRPPRDPSPELLDALCATADELDRSYRAFYAPDARQFTSTLAQIRPPAFRRLGRALPLHARILSAAVGPRLEPLPGDQPGTVYVAISRDGQSAWLTALGPDGVLTLLAGTPAVAVARGGTHSAPGGDPELPAYRTR